MSPQSEDGAQRTVMLMDMVAARCGFFSREGSINNGYHCSHPSQEITEFDDELKKTVGLCLHNSCPVACRAERDSRGRFTDDADSMDVFGLDSQGKEIRP